MEYNLCKANARTSRQDKAALLDLFDQAGGQHWFLKTGYIAGVTHLMQSIENLIWSIVTSDLDFHGLIGGIPATTHSSDQAGGQYWFFKTGYVIPAEHSKFNMEHDKFSSVFCMIKEEDGFGQHWFLKTGYKSPENLIRTPMN